MELLEIICKKPSIGPSPKFPYLGATVKDFDTSIFDSKTRVIGICRDGKYLSIVSSATFSGLTNLWELELYVLKPINKTTKQ
jgi:hypothetical protein